VDGAPIRAVCQFDEDNKFYLSAAKGFGRSTIDPGVDSFFSSVPTRPDTL
jgi:hypothetical protein